MNGDLGLIMLNAHDRFAESGVNADHATITSPMSMGVGHDPAPNCNQCSHAIFHGLGGNGLTGDLDAPGLQHWKPVIDCQPHDGAAGERRLLGNEIQLALHFCVEPHGQRLAEACFAGCWFGGFGFHLWCRVVNCVALLHNFKKKSGCV